jgi:hypothetical protein
MKKNKLAFSMSYSRRLKHKEADKIFNLMILAAQNLVGQMKAASSGGA